MLEALKKLAAVRNPWPAWPSAATSLPAEASISGYSGRPTSLVLPGQIEIEGGVYSITSVMANAFKGCRTLVTADLAGVERLEAQALYGCAKLASVTALGLVTVGTKAFCRCTSLTDLDLGDGLTRSARTGSGDALPWSPWGFRTASARSARTPSRGARRCRR